MSMFPELRGRGPKELSSLFLSGRGSAYITGAVIPVDGGIATTR